MSGHPITCNILLRAFNKKLIRLSFAGFGLLSYSSNYALADVVGFPGAEYDDGVIAVDATTEDFANGPTNGPHQSLTVNIPGGSGSLSGFLVPNPAVTASVTDTTAVQSTDNLHLVFHAEIFGPPGPVDLIIKAPGSSATSTVGAGASAGLTLTGLPDPNGRFGTYIYEDDSEGGRRVQTAFPGIADEITIPTLPGYIFRVDMQVSAGAAYSGGNLTTAGASIDPVFLLPAGYSIELSQGVGNSATPEPSTWAMMLIGFAGLGFVGYRVSRRTTIAI